MEFKDLGKNLRKIRISSDESITAAAKAIGVDRSYISRIEMGKVRPSIKILNSLISHFSVVGMDAIKLYSLANYRAGISISMPVGKSGVFTSEDNPQNFIYPNAKEPFRKEENNMEQNVNPNSGVQVNMPGIPVLYTDSCFITATQFGFVFDFAQTVGPTNQQNVVARVGMSRDHAEAVVKVLSEKLADTRLENVKTKLES